MSHFCSTGNSLCSRSRFFLQDLAGEFASDARTGGGAAPNAPARVPHAWDQMGWLRAMLWHLPRVHGRGLLHDY